VSAERLAGPAAQGAAGRRRVRPDRGQRPPALIHRRLQGALCQTAGGSAVARPDGNLEDAFVWKEARTLSQALTIHYDKVIFIPEPSDQAKASIGGRPSRRAAIDP